MIGSTITNARMPTKYRTVSNWSVNVRLLLGQQHGQVQGIKHDRNFLIPENLIVRVWVTCEL